MRESGCPTVPSYAALLQVQYSDPPLATPIPRFEHLATVLINGDPRLHCIPPTPDGHFNYQSSHQYGTNQQVYRCSHLAQRNTSVSKALSDFTFPTMILRRNRFLHCMRRGRVRDDPGIRQPASQPLANPSLLFDSYSCPTHSTRRN